MSIPQRPHRSIDADHDAALAEKAIENTQVQHVKALHAAIASIAKQRMDSIKRMQEREERHPFSTLRIDSGKIRVTGSSARKLW